MKHAKFKKLVDMYKDSIYSHALYFLGNRPDAEDVTQEVLIRAWKHVESIQKRTAKAWLIRVTHNLCIDYARRHKASRRVMKKEDMAVLEATAVSKEVESNPQQLTEIADIKSKVLSALQELPEQLRSVIMMREINEMKYEEISEALEIPLNSVKVYIHRGRNALKVALRKTLAEEIGLTL